MEQECFDHRTYFEKDDEYLRLWLKALNLKKPQNRPYVCSYYFVDKRPTEEHPSTEKWLGYDAPVQTRGDISSVHQHIQMKTTVVTQSLICVPMAPQHTNADTQWEVPALTDHSYVSREPVNKPTCHKQTQCGGAESLTHTILKNDIYFCRNSTRLASKCISLIKY